MIDTKYITTVQQYEDTEDYFVEIPDEICQELGWQEGDTIDWKTDDKGIILHKIQDASSIKEEPIKVNDWYKIKREEINHYLYNEETNKETY